MNLTDIIFLIIIGSFGIYGFWTGFVRAFGSLVGSFLGVYLAGRYYQDLANWLTSFTGWQLNTSKVLMFIIAFFIITSAIGVLFWFIDKIFKIVSIIPFVKTFNRLFGLGLGFLEGVLSVGLFVYFVERIPLSEKIMTGLAHSIIAPALSNIASIFLPLLPQALQLLHSTVDYVENVIK
ncbi:MAG: CvpA family protein [Candidatus Magasanikbacteria bacterium]